MILSIIDQIVFTVADKDISIGRLLAAVLVSILTLLAWRLALGAINKYEVAHKWDNHVRRSNNLRLSISFFLLGLALLFWVLGLEPVITTIKDYDLSLSSVLVLLSGGIMVFIADTFINQRIEEEFQSHNQPSPISSDPPERNKRTVNYLVFAFFLFFSLRHFHEFDPSFQLKANNTDIVISLSDIVLAVAVVLTTKILVWVVTHIFLTGIYRRNKIDIGRQFAFNRLITYLIYFIGILIALQNVGINMTMMWTGAAALLVGVGIALQQTISDFFSGIVILFERSLEVGDFIEVDGISGVLTRIDMRSSVVESQAHKTFVIPNSKLVNNNVINWSQKTNQTRFSIKVGVAYGSDTALVKKLLFQSLESVTHVHSRPKPFIRFQDFGDSSLDFELFFYSSHIWDIDDVRSDIRLNVDRLFREHGVTVPFPQRDIWMRQAE